MKLIARLLPCGLVLVFVASSVQAQSQQEKPYLCTLRHEITATASGTRQLAHPTFYMTGVFQYNLPPALSRQTNAPNILPDAFEKYIRETYRIPPNDYLAVECKLLAPTQDRQQYTLAAVEKLARSNKQEVIHVDWRYTPDQAVAPPAPPAPSASAATAQLSPSELAKRTTTRTFHYYCSSDQYQATLYFSAAFDVISPPGVPDLDYQQLANTFKQSLQQRYGYKGDVACFGDYKTLAAVQADEQRRIAGMRASRKWNIIATGWTYGGAAPAAPAAPAAAPVNATAITGVYNGDFRCARGPVNLKLTLVAPGDGSLTGLFRFDLPAKFVERTASYTLSGTYDAATGHFRLDPVEWVPPEPANFVMVGMDGALNSSADQVSGKITYGRCTTFEATRDKAQSAALPHAPAVTPAAAVARSAPTNANQMSPSAAAHPAPASPAAEGTAPATSAPQGQDPRVQQLPERFRRTAMGEGKGYCQGNGVLSGLFDCECFGKVVLDYRIAHVKEYYEVPRNSRHPALEQGTGGWMPLTTLILGKELNCSECISEKTAKWAAEQALKSTATWDSDSDKRYMTACVSKNFVANFRAKPYVSVYQELYAQALQSCLGQLKH